MEIDGFEWDDDKARTNFEKHGVALEDAIFVFDDPRPIDEFQSNIHGEERYIIIGMGETELLVVVYTIRDERIRIISARRPEEHERKRYADDQSQ